MNLLKEMWDIGYLHIAVVVLAICVLLSLFSAFMEARTYNKLCGGKASAWDALWVELRVEQCGANKR